MLLLLIEMRVSSKYFTENSTLDVLLEKVPESERLSKDCPEPLTLVLIPGKATKRTSILSPLNRRYFIQAWNSQCGACGVVLIREEYDDLSVKYFAHIDHFIALQHGGINALENLWPLCFYCHEEKSDAEIRKKFGGHYCIVCKEFGRHQDCFERQKRLLFNGQRFDMLKKQHCKNVITIQSRSSTIRPLVHVEHQPVNSSIFFKYAFRPS